MEQIEKIKRWALGRPGISALILSGSLAGRGKKDELSDYDIAIYGNDFSFIGDDKWLLEIGDYCICIHAHFELMGHTIPSRLTIFDPYCKVDFSFHPLQLLEELTKKLPWEYEMGYQVLLDKNGLAQRLPPPSYKNPVLEKPTIRDFQRNENEFWFETYHVAKYLRRGDLWTVKFRDWSAKENLRQMMEWNQASRVKWKLSVKDCGKGMEEWIDRKVWKNLFSCFGDFDAQDSWKALKTTIKLYRKLTRETAAVLGFPYNQKADAAISEFVKESKKVLNFR